MPLQFKELRHRCQLIVDQMDLPKPFSAESLCASLSQQRRRPIHLHPLPSSAMGKTACGVWIATDSDDHIFFESQTAELHQQHIILHEIGHLLFNHYSLRGQRIPDLTGLFSTLAPRTVRRLLTRASYTTVQEQEAEMLASLIRTATVPTREAPTTGVLGELEAALGVGGPRAR